MEPIENEDYYQELISEIKKKREQMIWDRNNITVSAPSPPTGILYYFDYKYTNLEDNEKDI